MGLAASQCRLLFVTSRQTDVSGKMQRISNDKMRLACDEDEVYSKFNRMYNTPKYTDLDGNDLNYNQIMGSSAAQNGLTTVITDYNGRVVLNSSMAGKLGLSGTGEGSQFRQKFPTIDGFIDKFGDSDVEDIKKVLNGTYIPPATEPTWAGHWRYALEHDKNIAALGEYKFNTTQDQSVNDFLASCGEVTSSNNAFTDFNISQEISGNNLIDIYDSDSFSNVKQKAKTKANNIINSTATVIGSKLGINNPSSLIESFLGNINNVIDSVTNASSVSETAANNKAKNGLLAFYVEREMNDSHSAMDIDYGCVLNLGEMVRRTAILVMNRAEDSETIQSINNMNGNNNYSGEQVSAPTGNINGSATNNKGLTKSEYESKLKGIFDWYVKENTNGEGQTANGGNWSVNYPDASMTWANALKIRQGGDIKEDSGVTIPPLIQNKANYYENLYNQLKVNGWVVPGDDVITTNLNQGLYYIQDGDNEREKISESDNYLEGKDKEMQDKAQAWYEHEINKINRKEKEMDTQMNKLQTEYTALTNDRNSIEQIIQKNIEKSFKFCQSG